MDVDGVRTPWWLSNAHAQTIWAAKLARRAPAFSMIPDWQRQRWCAPDGDFIDVDTTWGAPDQPQVILFHGLEGSSASHYAVAWASCAQALDWTLRVVHFRGCSGENNLAPRAYHSGDSTELDWILTRCAQEAAGLPLYAVGYSLGGNALVSWLGDCVGLHRESPVRVAAAIAAPLDLAAAGEAIARGLNRWIYTPMFLHTMRRKAKLKWEQFPGLFDLSRVLRARTLREFDDAFTAPVHGYKGVDDYWARASGRHRLGSISTPTLLVNAENDPFVPIASIRAGAVHRSNIQYWQPRDGGHAGFGHHPEGGDWRGELWHMPMAVMAWMREVS